MLRDLVQHQAKSIRIIYLYLCFLFVFVYLWTHDPPAFGGSVGAK